MRRLGSLVLFILAGAPSIAGAAHEHVIDRTFGGARKDAIAIVAALRRSRALPAELKAAALALVDKAKRHVEHGDIEWHGRHGGGDNTAYVHLKDGRSAKVDSANGFVELHAEQGGRLTDWGDLYLFGAQDPNRVGAVTFRTLVSRPRETQVKELEAYLVPGQERESWLLYERTRPYDPAQPHATDRAALSAMKAAGLAIHDTGPARALLPSPDLSAALKRLVDENPAFKLITADR
jgi:hypothetical protein